MSDTTPTPLFKDFDIIIAERRETRKDKIRPQFKIGGEVFSCKKTMSAKAAIELGKLASDGSAGSLFDFITRSLIPADRGRFDAVIEADEDGDYDVELTGDIVTSIVEQYAGRPTQES